jgi:hypothetical protein|nr:MAG TPA: hypothetical protein [Caudoviricetes sp.]
MKIKEVSVVSRRSVKINNDFMTFECMLKADVEDDYEGGIKDLWDEAHSQVDKQIEDAVEQF